MYKFYLDFCFCGSYIIERKNLGAFVHFTGVKMDNRFKVEGEEKKYEVQKIWDHHRQIIRLLVASNGSYTNQDIADQVGCSAQTVSNVRNSPIVKARVAMMHREADKNAVSIAERIRIIAPMAVDVLRQTMEQTMATNKDGESVCDDKLRSQGVRSAIAVLDHAHAKTVNAAVFHGHMTLAEITEIKSRVRSAKPAELIEPQEAVCSQ
jgi:hypothetical protein